jgi:flagellar biosynthesis protein FlhF
MRRDIQRRRFRGRELSAVSAQVRASLGDDAVVLRTMHVASGLEIVAASSRDVERFRARVTPAPLHDAHEGRRYVVALVGPTGAGKTTTAVKLALHDAAFGGRRVGFVTLDTYRAGAVAQLETYAGVAGIPMEVVYEADDVEPALARLAHCDAVIVDTPGRGPKSADDDGWRELLAALAPDETHLVMPATIRGDVAEAVCERIGGITHLALTKLDEVTGDAGVADLAARLDLPVRWIADGQSIPIDLAPGVPRLMHALGADAEVWS